NRAARRARTKAPAPKKAALSVESLEGRLMPKTTLYVDFGLGLQAGGLTTTVADPSSPLGNLRDIVGGATRAGPDFSVALVQGATPPPATAQVNFAQVSLPFDYNGDGANNRNDLLSLETDVMRVLDRTFQPFDVAIRPSQAASITGINNKLAE